MSSVPDSTFVDVKDNRTPAELLERLAEHGVKRIAAVPLAAIPLEVPDQVGWFAVLAESRYTFELVHGNQN